MRTIGFDIGKGILRHVVLEGSMSQPIYVDRGKSVVPPELSVSARMLWFREAFSAQLATPNIERCAYRMHMGRGMTQEQIAAFHYPWGVLNMLCAERSIEVVEVVGASLTAKRFGLAKGEKPMELCDHRIGAPPPRWDDHQRYAACAAWAALA